MVCTRTKPWSPPNKNLLALIFVTKRQRMSVLDICRSLNNTLYFARDTTHAAKCHDARWYYRTQLFPESSIFNSNTRSTQYCSAVARVKWVGGHASGGGASRSGGSPRKFWNSEAGRMLFPAFSKTYLWFTHIANYLLRTLSQQTNAQWEYNTWNVNYKIENRLSLYLETSKCFTFQSHHSKLVVIKLSELP